MRCIRFYKLAKSLPNAGIVRRKLSRPPAGREFGVSETQRLTRNEPIGMPGAQLASPANRKASGPQTGAQCSDDCRHIVEL